MEGWRVGSDEERSRLTKVNKTLMPRCTGRGCSSRQSVMHTESVVRLEQRYIVLTYRDRVLPWMPAGMQDLLVEVQRVQRHVFPQAAWPAVLHPDLVPRQRPTHLLRLERRLIRLEYDVIERINVVYPEVVVIRSSEDVPRAQRVS